MTLNVLGYIHELNSQAIQLNNLFYKYYRLDDYDDLKESDPFERPIISVKKGLVSRKGTLDIERKVEYSFHGTGVSFRYDGLSISFQYYPVTMPIRKPSFGIMGLFDFIDSKGHSLTFDDKVQIEHELNDLVARGLLSFWHEGYSQYYINE